jgi:ATP-binding cassette subfamily B protein/ATP-binding cassette subfamily C protein
MKDQKMLNSNKVVIQYFINLVSRLTPQYIPTLIASSMIKTMRPMVYIFGPKLIVDELMSAQRIDSLIMIIALIAGSNFILSSAEKILKAKSDLLTDQFNNAFERHISKKTVEIDFENVEDPEVLNLKERALFAVRNHGLMFAMVDALSKVVNEGFLIFTLSAVIWTFSPWVLLFLLGAVIINSFLFKRVQKYYYMESTNTVSANRAFVYFITQSGDLEIAKDLRLYDTSKLILDKMNRFNLQTYTEYIKVYGNISRLNGLVNVNAQIQNVLVYLLLAYRTLQGTVTLGNFMMYAGTVSKYSMSMNTLVSSTIEVNRLCRQLELLVEYEKIPASKDSGEIPVPENVPYVIEFHNVTFKYPRSKTETLKNISVTIKHGEKISIIGLNGAGKTTFVKLLTRLYKPTTGMITLNGIDIQTLDYESYMSKIAAVFQDYKLLGVTVAENITGQKSEKIVKDSNENETKSGAEIQVSDDENKNANFINHLYEILDEVGVRKDIESLKEGIDTPLDKGYDKNATKLSGGQAQKLAIARALYKDASIVVLDEPTAALDPLAEHDIYCRFDELVHNKTAIYISHRLSSCRFCDRILVFDEGQIIQTGSHDELIKHKGAMYERMFNAQATYYSA